MRWPRRFLDAAVLLLILRGAPAAADTAMPRNCFHTSDGVELCVMEQLLDDAHQPTLVFVPGWGMPAAVWEKQIAHFAGRRSVLAFDPRGQGESAAPRDGYTLDRRARDLKELLDRYPQRSFILVGWSLAVHEALAYLDHYGPARLRGLALVDNSIGEGPEPPPRQGENPFFAELRTDRATSLRDFIGAIFRTDPGDRLRATLLASALKTELEDSIRLLSHGTPRDRWKEILYRTELPVLYLVTARWRDQAELLARNHPTARAEVFDQAGHALFWDEAERFNRLLEDFATRAAP